MATPHEDARLEARRLENEIFQSKVSMKLLDYAEEITKKLQKDEDITGITMIHANYLISFFREFIQEK